MAENHWSSFWKRPNAAFDRVMKVSTDFFYRELNKRHPLKPGSKVLDYGCGPGFLIDNFVASNVAVTGADINDHFLELNRKRFPTTEFILISENPDVTVKVLSEKLAGRNFDQIILLSIVQYFRSAEEVANVVKFLKDFLSPTGRLIIADVLDANTSSVRDAIGIFFECILRGRLFAFIKFIAYLVFSDYRNVSKDNKLLLLSSNAMQQMAKESSLGVTEIKGLTPHPTRTNYIFSTTAHLN